MLHLKPPAWTKDELSKLKAAGCTVSSAFSPRDNSLAVFTSTTKASSSSWTGAVPIDNDVYLTTLDRVPSKLRRDFVSDTYVTFSKLSRHITDLRTRDPLLLQSEDALTTYSNVVDDYLVALSAHIEALEHRGPSSQRSSAHYQSLYSSLHLMQTVYLPASGSRRGLVGEELLDWLNRNFIAPSTEEGVSLAALDTPWTDANFWPYIVRSVLRGMARSAVHFLAKLENHPSPYLQHLAGSLVPLLGAHPRSSAYGMDNEFFLAWRQWKERVAVLRREFDAMPQREGVDEWRAEVSDILGILEGNAEVVLRSCKDSEAGWREAVCVWGVWVRVGLRRDDLPELVKDVVEQLPADSTSVEDMLHMALLEGTFGKVIEHANALDIWLVAHMTDVLGPLSVLDDLPDQETAVSVRDYLVLSYAEYLRADPHLWRITVDYMYTCGELGERMADQILLTVPITRADAGGETRDVEMGDATTAATAPSSSATNDATIGGVEALSEICREHAREHVRRQICKNAARIFLQQADYGLAISYYLSAEDYAGIGRAANRLLDEFVEHGPQKFIEKAGQIAIGLHLPENLGEQAVFAHRLLFVQRYAEFHKLCQDGDLSTAAEHLIDMFNAEIVPRTWWALLLADASELLSSGQLVFRSDEICELLGRLEVLQSRVQNGYSAESLGVLAKIGQGDRTRLATKRLEVVRLSLARYYARCGSIGVGGRGHLVDDWVVA
ncbi:hypothetical protein EXIGLDRAFT_723166 [Exidia glandulosa HHB12029]|uniref:Nuclear pore complex protein Nup85 n=1 Tax=Exidia glandulosa HHB12029 TaxID=1314781 RepID=A0A165N003_EXIGL|nr:hypothetical protein EXIGLDRAFT_723166 [Exidia glandulosa HHB12029]